MHMNILITGGGCREPVDSIRCITNTSTGRTASFLANSFVLRGASVTALMAETAVLPDTGCCRTRLFRTSADLAGLLEEELSKHSYDAVVHAAAVSDFRPSVVTVNGQSFPAGSGIGKIPSGAIMSVAFESVPKIADSLKTWSIRGNPSGTTVFICFKLTDGAGHCERQQASARILDHAVADYVVSNDLSEIADGKHLFELFGRGKNQEKSIVSVCRGKTLLDMANALYSVVGGNAI